MRQIAETASVTAIQNPVGLHFEPMTPEQLLVQSDLVVSIRHDPESDSLEAPGNTRPMRVSRLTARFQSSRDNGNDGLPDPS
jgi:hypothetical protein